MTNEMQPVRTHLEKFKTRSNQAQHDLAVFPKVDGRRSARQWKTYARAKHYAFRQPLAAKCKLLGKTFIVCSEM
jgi:hypothetical protein